MEKNDYAYVLYDTLDDAFLGLGYDHLGEVYGAIFQDVQHDSVELFTDRHIMVYKGSYVQAIVEKNVPEDMTIEEYQNHLVLVPLRVFWGEELLPCYEVFWERAESLVDKYCI